MFIMGFNQINEMAQELLGNFGHYCDPDASLGNKTSDPYILLEEYGLGIVKYVKSGDLIITYNDYMVYNYKRNLCQDGIWKEVLKEYYKNISVIIENNENKRIQLEKCHKLFSLLHRYINISYDCTTKINDHLTLVQSKGLQDNGLDYKYFELFKDNLIVFSYKNETTYGDYFSYGNKETFPTYIPGEWEQELENIENYKNAEFKKLILQNKLNE